jgi:hypothetical protein
MSSKALVPGSDATETISSSDTVIARAAFAYAPLDYSLDLNATRLLRILPELFDGYIQIRIQQGPLGTIRLEAASQSSEALNQNSITGYRCFSYTWGEPCEGREVLLNGYTFLVRHNLFESLDTARQLFPMEFLWIDAVCVE